MKSYMGIIKSISGVIIIIAGLVMFFNGFVGINNQLNIRNENLNEGNIVENNEQAQENEENKIEPIDFTLYDQYGNRHTLSEYKGKIVFLNFWATWCPPCRGEMPHMEELYNEYNKNQDDVVILGVASPNLGREGNENDIKDFLSEEGYTFPVVLDNNGAMVYDYGISAFPTTFIIDKEGYITKYIPGAMDKSTMQNVIEGER